MKNGPWARNPLKINTTQDWTLKSPYSWSQDAPGSSHIPPRSQSGGTKFDNRYPRTLQKIKWIACDFCGAILRRTSFKCQSWYLQSSCCGGLLHNIQQHSQTRFCQQACPTPCSLDKMFSEKLPLIGTSFFPDPTPNPSPLQLASWNVRITRQKNDMI